jgi:spermidine/putrescine transport system permease protein
MEVATEGRAGPRVRRSLVPYLLLLPGIAWLVAFYVWPMVQMFFIALQEGSLERGYQLTWNWAQYAAVLSRYSTQLVRSVEYGLVVTLACLLIGYPLAYFIALYGGRWKNALLFMVILPFFVSFLIRTLMWRLTLADNGLVLGTIKELGLLPDDFRVLATPFAVLAGLTYSFLPFMTLPLYASLEKLDRSLLEAAQDLYSSRRVAFLKVTLPLSLPGVFAGSLLTFIPAVGDFINATFLGGPNTTMIGNVIQRRMLISNDYAEGAALSFILMAAILVGVAVYAWILGTEELTG